MADERVKEKEGEIKRGGCITCYSICYTELIVYCDWRRHLSKAVKLPMNYPALTPFSLSLSLYILPSLFIFLFLPLGACLRDSLSFSLFVSPLSHIPVSERYQQHGMCRRGMKCICHCFYIYALFLPHAVYISHCVLKPVFVSLVLL